MKTSRITLVSSYGAFLRSDDGEIITISSDTRYCSDAFSIQCRNAECENVIFSLDTSNREVILYLASAVGVDRAMVRDLLAETVESPGA